MVCTPKRATRRYVPSRTRTSFSAQSPSSVATECVRHSRLILGKQRSATRPTRIEHLNAYGTPTAAIRVTKAVLPERWHTLTACSMTDAWSRLTSQLPFELLFLKPQHPGREELCIGPLLSIQGTHHSRGPGIGGCPPSASQETIPWRL